MSVKCRISLNSMYVDQIGKYYCDTCSGFFDDREHPPCGVNGFTEEQLAEQRRIREVNKEAYSRMKALAYFQCVGGRDGVEKWKDPK